MDFYQDRPLVFGHRGAREVAPENTLAAFQAALAMDADGIELDVMLSADGVPVVIHDFTLERTSNGQGQVGERTLAQLQALDAGSYFAPRFAEERLPTLAQVLDALGGSLRINIELKSRTWAETGLEKSVAELVAQRGLNSSVIVSSFNPLSLWRMRRINPRIARGLLYERHMPLCLRRAWAAPFLGLNAVHPQAGMVDAAYMRWARGKRYRVNVWTVNEPAEMERLLALGVDTLITDRPDVARKVVDARRGAAG